MDALLENDQFDKEVAQIVEKTCKALSQDKQTEVIKVSFMKIFIFFNQT
jgi:hypothetical protein